MKSIFDKVSAECSKLTTKAYSTSFSLGIYFLGAKLRPAIYGIYGFVRFADEIVDSFEKYEQEYLLLKFKTETYEAIEKGISLNPILNSFQEVVNKYNIEHDLIDTFLKSMEMDLKMKTFTKEKYEEYILGSAEVVGLMCLKVFTEGDQQRYSDLKPFAMRLGAAFQKINFLRDISADFADLGRTYFPNIDMEKFNSEGKFKIEQEIAEDFKIALEGIKKLPDSAKVGVYLAYVYYVALFEKIKKIPAQNILNERIRVGDVQKLVLMARSLLRFKLNLV
jgi:15-cis-phytoene synthase